LLFTDNTITEGKPILLIMNSTTTSNIAIPSVTLKVQYEDDLRRFALPSTSLNVLKDELIKRYGLKPNAKLSIKYMDEDSDLITITEDAELGEAVQRASSGVLKLFLTIKRRELRPFGAVACATAVPPAVAHSNAPPALSLGASMADRQTRMEQIKKWKEEKRAAHQQQKQARVGQKGCRLEMKHMRQGQKQFQADSCGKKFKARFVKDVGFEDGTELAPGAKFTKIWRFRNDGSEAWPQGCKLLFISWKAGDQMSGPECVTLAESVQPGAEVDVSIELTAPEKPGRYAGHYKLCTPEGNKFGDRVRNLIFVVSPDSTSSSSEGEVQKVDVTKPPYSIALTQLEQMGFSDKHINTKLVRKFGGDINKVTKKLIRHQRCVDRRKH